MRVLLITAFNAVLMSTLAHAADEKIKVSANKPAATTPSAAAVVVPEWQGIKFGIDEATLLASGKNITKRATRDTIENPPQYADYEISDYQVVGMPAKVAFFFGRGSQRLETVNLTLKNLTKIDGALKCEHLESSLSQKYGSPVANKRSPSSFTTWITTNWIADNMNIKLLCSVGNFYNDVSVSYESRSGADTSGL